MAGNDEDRGRSRRPGAEDRERSHRSGTRGWTIERSSDTVCGLHRTCRNDERRFLG
jgi:hypothetical protein